MSSAQAADLDTNEETKRLNAWLARLRELIASVESWSTEADWRAKKIEIRQEEGALRYQAPALLLQKDDVKVLLQPVTSRAPGAEGVVDLYSLPAYDDIASLYFIDGEWRLHYLFPGQKVGSGHWSPRDVASLPLDKVTLGRVLDEMSRNAGE